MFIGIIGSGDRAYVYLLRSYRKDGKVLKEKLQSFGRLRDLIKDNPNALEELKAKYNKDWDAVRASETELALKKINDPAPAGDVSRNLPLLNYCHFILKEIWVKELNLHKLFSSLQTSVYKKFTGNLNKVVSTMVFLKTHAPGSIVSAFRQKADLLGAPLENTTLHQMYWCLDVLAGNKDRIMNLVNLRMADKTGKKRRMLFYDVTNIYFESPFSDEEALRYREDCAEEVIAILEKALKAGLVEKPEGGWDNYKLQDAPPQLRAELRAALFFKMRGFSKEHRNDLPIVSIALVIDENAIPIDVELYSGCSSEYKTMRNSIEAMKAKHGIRNVVVVADRGLNSAANLQMLLDSGYGFIVAQKVTNLGQEMTGKMLDAGGYEEEIKKNSAGEIDDVIRRKIVDWVKTDNKGHKVPCKLVLCHSKKRAAHDYSALLENVVKAKEAVDSGAGVPYAQREWRAFIKSSPKTEGGESKFTIDADAIKKANDLCGYYAMVYHNVPGASPESTLTDDEIKNSYQHLVQIEDCFRLMKNNLKVRPACVWTENHIRGHVLCCVLALVLLRRLQLLLKEQGQNYSIDDIQSALRQATLVCVLGKDDDCAYFARAASYQNYYKGKHLLTREELKKHVTAEIENHKLTGTDLLMTAVKLQPLPRICSKESLSNFLKTKFSKLQDMIDSYTYSLATGTLHNEFLAESDR